jgi:uncharacterized membrane protein YhaH (DUF805 family)
MTAITQFVSFRGRISRKTFWLTWLALFGINLAVGLLIGLVSRSNQDVSRVLYLLWLPLCIYMSLPMQAKRWHDRGKSGWMILVNFIPIVGPLWALIELGFLRGTPITNRYGESPLAPAVVSAPPTT